MPSNSALVSDVCAEALRTFYNAPQRGREKASPVMSELDRLKEQLAYLEFWLGIMVVTDISLVGWLLSAGSTAATVALVLAIIGVISLTIGIFVLHRQSNAGSSKSVNCSHGNAHRRRDACRSVGLRRHRA